MLSLVQPLFDGPIDVVGDVHGELDALLDLLRHLGYDRLGSHPEGRRLIFVGDLTDRGPDNPGVVAFVQSLVESGKAQCVLGNHDLNLLLGRKKFDNSWFFGKEFRKYGYLVPQVLANDGIRDSIKKFLGTLPLALEREDVRVVHACWHPTMIELAKTAESAVTLFEAHRQLIEADHKSRPSLGKFDRKLDHQNRNPVKVLTSGVKRWFEKPAKLGRKMPKLKRVRWWEAYSDPQMCIFGHYCMSIGTRYRNGQAHCINFTVGKRWMERPQSSSQFKTRLAAFRLPEILIVFDDGRIERPLHIGK